MPELPEVETMCRGIHAAIGRTIRSVSTPPCRYRPIQIKPSISSIAKQLDDQRVTDISRLGKRVLIHTRQHVLALQPKMSGLVTTTEAPDPDHVRLKIDFRGRPSLYVLFWDRRGLGTVEMLPHAKIHERLIANRLGPDALVITVEEFAERLRATQRPIKVALLDQKLVAGVGNLYASEMLHSAGIRPQKPAASVSKARLAKLHAEMLRILHEAIEQEGSTLSDGTYRNALNDPGNYQSRHLVYDRAGLPCPNCQDATVRRIVQAQRSTFYCPKCQSR